MLVALVAAAALTACAAPGADPASPGSTGAAPMTSLPDPSATPNDPQNPADPTKPAGAARTLTGTVESGVEPNCFLLDGNLLVGAPRGTLRAGARVTVTGHSQPDLITTCQQGVPFVVDSVRPA